MIRFALLGAGRIGQMHAANIAGHERCNGVGFMMSTLHLAKPCVQNWSQRSLEIQVKFLTMLKLTRFLWPPPLPLTQISSFALLSREGSPM